MSFLTSYDAIAGATGSTPLEIARAQAALVGQWLGENPAGLFAELRASRPVFETPGLVLLARAREVRESLSRPNIFTVAPNTPKMARIAPSGFMLGTDDMADYFNDVGLMRSVMRADDLLQLQPFLREQVDNALGKVQFEGRFDVVADISRHIPYLFVANYFGVPGPSPAVLKEWARHIFEDLFLNLADDAAIREPAIASGKALAAYLDEHIATRDAELQSGATSTDSVLDRLLLLPIGWHDGQFRPLDHAKIRDNLIGFLVGAIDTTSKALVNVLGELLKRPEWWQQAQEAANQGDDETLLAIIFEALRFNPQSIAVVRLCIADHDFGDGLPVVKAGTLVMVGTWSALFDPTLVEEPNEFRLGRSLPSDFLHFGYGMHACFGRHFARLMLLEMARGLLQLPDLHPATGAEGQIVNDGPFPDQWILEFEAPCALEQTF